MKPPSLSTQCLLALGLGMGFGMMAPPALVLMIVPLGEAFIKLLFMLVVPLTFFTLVNSLCRYENLADVGGLSVRTLSWFLITAFLATLIALGVGNALGPGAGYHFPAAELPSWQPREIPNFSVLFLDLIPGNLVTTFASMNVLPIIFFSLLFGSALNMTTPPGSTLRLFFEEGSQTFFRLTRWIIRCSPIAVFALIAPVTAEYGIEGMKPLAGFIIAVYLACAGQLIIYALLVWSFTRMSPWHFYRAIWPMMVMGFSTSSSLATLPITLTTLTIRLSLPEKLVSFIAPLGATMKMDGCGAIFPILIALFTANMLGYSLTWEQYIVLGVTAIIATIGTSAVPGTASIMATVALTSIGLPLEGLALVLGIDKIIDVMRTVVNVTGTAACSLLVAGKLATHSHK